MLYKYYKPIVTVIFFLPYANPSKSLRAQPEAVDDNYQISEDSDI